MPEPSTLEKAIRATCAATNECSYPGANCERHCAAFIGSVKVTIAAILDDPDEAMVEAIARIWAAGAFNTVGLGMSVQNHLVLRRFLHAEKTVKAARRKAARSLAALREHLLGELR